MMSFLAKAMQSPGFFAQLVQQQNESNRCIAGVSKKRRLPKQEDNSEDDNVNAPDGQIIKYQPLMNEAAKAMLRQILNFDAPPQFETDNNPNSFLIDDVPSPSSALDNESSSSRVSRVTLSDVPHLPVSSGISTAKAEIHSSPAFVTDMVTTAQLPDMSVLGGGQLDMVMPEFPQIEGMVPQSNVDIIPDANYVDHETGNGVYMDPMIMGVDGIMPIENNEYSSDLDVDIFLDGIKLPGINDSFWEQFLSPSQLNGETDEIEASPPDHTTKEDEQQPGQENGWHRSQHMDQLTEQMGLLSPETKEG